MAKKNKIGLFFGSFNPIHVGHLIIANFFIEYTDISNVWFVISPHNPLKEKKSLLPDYHRLAIANIAIEENPKLKASNIEFKLPQPSYTINTLAYLKEKYPTKEFVLLMGEDNLASLDKWKNYEILTEQNQIYVYRRPNTPESIFHKHLNVKIYNAPLMDISSSYIRKAISEGKDVRYLLPETVYQYVMEMHFYENLSK